MDLEINWLIRSFENLLPPLKLTTDPSTCWSIFEQDVTLVFLDDGVFQLKKNQDTSGIGTKNFSKTYAALEMYDVEKLYVEEQSLKQRGLTQDDLSVDVKIISSDEIKKLISESEVILNF